MKALKWVSTEPIKKQEKIGRNMPCWCGSGRKYKQCHEAFDRKIDRFAFMGHEVPTRDLLKMEEDVQKCRESARINMAALDAVAEAIRPGMNTLEIDKIVYDVTTKMGGIPAPLDYEGYPFSVCTSVNDQVCHGFPSEDVILKEGDIVNVDCSTILDGYFSDSSRMFMIGEVAPEVKRLVEVTLECVEIGVKAVKPWGFLGDMAEQVHKHAEANGYSVVKEIGGHGVGFEFHEEPWVSYVSNAGEDMLIVPGMMFTIEPMVNMGKADIYTNEDNGWEVHTKDGKPSAQWEYQIFVREDGVEVISH
ncbi:MAG: methionyl aminopeptidase [Lachnospiraceae bacterium]|nr:methionyl aminopeptidase [Lachnospiraceae bacterium]